MNQPQLSLLADTPIARRRDPSTSKEAASAITVSGARAHQQNATFDAVRASPGCTSAELARHMGIDRYITARRLPELRAQGLVRNGEDRCCSVMGRNALTWWPADTSLPAAA